MGSAKNMLYGTAIGLACLLPSAAAAEEYTLKDVVPSLQANGTPEEWGENVKYRGQIDVQIPDPQNPSRMVPAIAMVRFSDAGNDYSGRAADDDVLGITVRYYAPDGLVHERTVADMGADGCDVRTDRYYDEIYRKGAFSMTDGNPKGCYPMLLETLDWIVGALNDGERFNDRGEEERIAGNKY